MRHNLSDVHALVRDRRSIPPKDYTDREVRRDVVEAVLGNAIWAPNHGMTQPWRFTVFTGEGRKRLAAFCGEEYRRSTPEGKFLGRKHASLVERPLQSSVAVALGVEHEAGGKIPLEEEEWAMACAVQNMYLTCTAYGLGAYWSTSKVLTGAAMARFLGLGPEGRCMGLFYMGYPKVEWPKGYRKSVRDLVRHVDQ